MSNIGLVLVTLIILGTIVNQIRTRLLEPQAGWVLQKLRGERLRSAGATGRAPGIGMIRRLLLGVWLLLTCMTAAHPPAWAQAAPVMACPSIQAYARNIWEMQTWNDSLWIGCGDASNLTSDAARNAMTRKLITSPLVIYSNGGFVPIPLSEEQVTHIRIINGVPFIPGMDATDTPTPPSDDWDFSNLYRWTALGVLEKLRTIPNGLHTFDLAACGVNLLCAAISAQGIQAFAFSTDFGSTWHELTVPSSALLPLAVYFTPPRCTDTNLYAASRGYSLFSFGGVLYMTTSGTIQIDCSSGSPLPTYGNYLVKWTYTNNRLTIVPTSLPGNRIERAVEFAGHLVALNATTTNDQQWYLPRLFVTDAGWNITYPDLPNCTRPQDIKIIEATLYILCNTPDGANQRVAIEETSDLVNWTEIAVTTQPTFGRSFAQLDDHWWIGLGIDVSPSTAAQAASGLLIEVN